MIRDSEATAFACASRSIDQAYSKYDIAYAPIPSAGTVSLFKFLY